MQRMSLGLQRQQCVFRAEAAGPGDEPTDTGVKVL